MLKPVKKQIVLLYIMQLTEESGRLNTFLFFLAFLDLRNALKIYLKMKIGDVKQFINKIF